MASVCVSAIMLIASATLQSAFPVINIPNDPQARYEVLMLTATRGGMLEIVTRRTGSRGETYVQREIDCRENTFRYLGQGHTVDEMNADHHAYRITMIDPNAISGHIAAYACENVVRNR